MENITPTENSQTEVQNQIFSEGPSALAEWLEKNIKTILGVVLAAVVVALGMIAQDYFAKRTEKKLSNELFVLKNEVTKIQDEFNRAKYQGLDASAKKTENKELKKATGDIAKDYGVKLESLEKFALQHSKQVAGVDAALLAASIYSEYGKHKEAASLLSHFEQDFSMSTSALIYGLIKLSYGTELASSGDCVQAISIWKKMDNEKKLEFIQAQAQLKMGVCYESNKQIDQAKEQYKKAAESHDQQASQKAKTLIRALEYSKK